MAKIVAKRTGENGTIDSYKLENGQVIDKDYAVCMADLGELPGISAFSTKDGGRSIRSDRGGEGYSLSELPEF